MIRSFRHKGLADLFTTGKSAKIGPDMQTRCIILLDALDAAIQPADMNAPGFYFHSLHGNPVRYSVRVNKNWRITFEWEEGDALRVDLEDDH